MTETHRATKTHVEEVTLALALALAKCFLMNLCKCSFCGYPGLLVDRNDFRLMLPLIIMGVASLVSNTCFYLTTRLRTVLHSAPYKVVVQLLASTCIYDMMIAIFYFIWLLKNYGDLSIQKHRQYAANCTVTLRTANKNDTGAGPTSYLRREYGQ